MNEERWEVYKKLNPIFLEIMEWLCGTKFYKNTYEERKKYNEDIKEKWKFVDFKIMSGDLENVQAILIGEIPHYKSDHEKSIYIDTKHIDNCCLYRGYATGLYANRVIKNEFKIPKYMQQDLKKFIERYNEVKING